MTPTPAIQTKSLSMRFKNSVAVDRLDIEVRHGEMFGLVGPDGSGKTTIMRLLASILTPSSGDAWVDGLHVVREAENVKAVIGYMSQRFGLYPDLTVDENIHFYADVYGVPKGGERTLRVGRLMQFSRLEPFRKRLAGNLSGGMKQKLGLACALVHTPKVLLLDEPTNGVDPVSRRDFWRILSGLRDEGVTVLMSTAYLDEAERCDRVALLDGGRVIACDTPSAVKAVMSDRIVEVLAEDPRRAAETLRSAAELDSVSLFGNRLKVVGRTQESAAAASRQALSAAGIAVSGVRRVDAVLEDVFVALLGGKGGGVGHGS